jgi:hypothetical protein
MNPEQAAQHIRAHERIANDPETRPSKRAQHLASVRWLREQFEIPEPAIVKAIPATEFERLQARLVPHVASHPTNWTNKESYRK